MKRITTILAAGFAAACLTAPVSAAPLYDLQTEAPAVSFIGGESAAAENTDISAGNAGWQTVYLSENEDFYTYEVQEELPAEDGEKTLTAQDVLKKILYAFIAGVIIALIVCLVMKSRMKTVRTKATANDYIRKNSFNITRSRDIFIYSEISKKKRVKEENKK